MPRNSAAVIQSKTVDTTVQAIVRSKRSAVGAARKRSSSDLAGDSVNGSYVPHTAAKLHTSRLPRPKVVRIQQRYIAGENQTQIAKAERCDRETVSRIVRSSEMAEYVERMKEEFRGLVPEALDTLRYALQTQRDARTAYEVLRDVGVAPRRGEPMQLPETTPENGYSRQAILMANALLEAHETMGVDLPKDLEDALAKESPKSSEGAKDKRRF